MAQTASASHNKVKEVANKHDAQPNDGKEGDQQTHLDAP
jgi:hypothetical protein